MSHLEHAIGDTLFVRHPKGYELTEAGEELLAETQLTEASVLAIEQRIARRATTHPVTISAGTWMTYFVEVAT